MPTTWGTGQDVEKTGLYVATCPRLHRDKKRVKLARGEPFPPCPERGCGAIVVWRLEVQLDH